MFLHNGVQLFLYVGYFINIGLCFCDNIIYTFLCLRYQDEVSEDLINFAAVLKEIISIHVLNTGRPSMDILVRSCQDLEKILPRLARCHGKILSREPCSQDKFCCKILFGQKKICKEVNKNQHFSRFVLSDIKIFC